jgi:hypothetical protein
VKDGVHKLRSPLLTAKRRDRRRRRKVDPFLQQPRGTRKDGRPWAKNDGFSMHAAKRRLGTDEQFGQAVGNIIIEAPTAPTQKIAKQRIRKALKRVWNLLRGKETP